MSHETPGIRWFASELIRFFWRQAIGEVRTYAGWGHRLSLAERGKVTAWLASTESQVWWHFLEDVDQTRALAQDPFVEAVEEILAQDADPKHVGELEDSDRELLTEALHYLEVLREREREGVPAPRGEAWKHLLESAAEEGEVSEETQSMTPTEHFVAIVEALKDQGWISYYQEAAEIAGIHDTTLSNIRHGRQTITEETSALYVSRLCTHFDVPETALLTGSSTPPEEPARNETQIEDTGEKTSRDGPSNSAGGEHPETHPALDTPREESPSRPESGEEGTDSVSAEPPEAPSVEPEETGSTPGGETVCEDPAQESSQEDVLENPVQESPTPDGPRPTIRLENGAQAFIASRNGGEKWDLELRVEGVDPEVAEKLHDVAFGLLFPRVGEEAGAA